MSHILRPRWFAKIADKIHTCVSLQKFLLQPTISQAGEESSLVLRAFYLAQSKLELRLMSTPILFRTATRPQFRVNSSMALTVAPFSTPRARVKPSSELQSGIRLSAIFGGQGPKYLEELRETFLSYPYTHSFLERINAVIEAELVSDECRKLPDGFYHHGLNFMTWLRAPSSASPPADYLASAPISFPMIGITQLCNFYAFAIASGQNVGGLVDKLHSITGHSQGLVSAVAVACSRSNQVHTSIDNPPPPTN